METDIVIRDAEADDIPSLGGLMAEMGYPNDPRDALERFSRLASPESRVLVAEKGGEIVGLITLHRTRYLHRPDDGRITTLVTTERVRRTGVGRRLVEAAEAVIGEWGCARVELTSGVQREGAHAFYEHIGYVQNSKRFIKPLD